MKNKIRSKRLISAIIVVGVILSLSTVAVFAVQYPNKTVRLYSNETGKESAFVYGYYKEFAARNYSSSTQNMRAIARYYVNGSWYYDYTSDIVLVPGATVDFMRTNYLNSETYWLLRLNPTNNSSGSNGYGWIWYDMG